MKKLTSYQTVGLVQKAVEGSENRFRFILSTEKVDRVGDIIRADGWRLKDFKKNPIALAYHDHSKPIGRWHNVKIENKQLTGELELAPDDVGPMQRAINQLIRLGFLKSVSVGFTPLEYQYRDEDDPWKGYEFIKQDLNEVSVVSVPANPEAIALAKSCDLNSDEIQKLFRGKEGRQVRADFPKAKTGKALAKVNQLINKIDKVTKWPR